MKGDYSRFSFDPKKHYRAVLMQQGRLQLDADWNEQVQIAEHRYSAFFRALVGRSGTPRGENREMKLELKDDGSLTLTKGVYYIDGLLIENESQQDNLPVPNEAEEYLCYLDAWAREVNAVEDGELIDPAVGVETTTRLKTEWAVRYEKINVDDELKKKYQAGEWLPSSGDWWRPLSTGTLKIASDSLKVKIRDNCLYRVEVHRDSPASTEFVFKWSRDNASVCAEVIADPNATTSQKFTLKNNSVNTQNAFKGAARIELCASGETVLMLDGSQFENGILSLKSAVNVSPKMVIRRWDGVSPEVKAGTSGTLEIEEGIKFDYSREFYRSGDYWLILVRNGKIENWIANECKLADGVEHHFAALGVISRGNQRPRDGLEPEDSAGGAGKKGGKVGAALSPVSTEKAAAGLGVANLSFVPAVEDAATIASPPVSIAKGTVGLTPLHLVFDPLTSPDLSTPGNVKVGGNLTVKSLTVESTANITGNTTIGGNLQASAISGITGNFSQPANVMELLLLGVTPQSLVFDSGIADSKTVSLFSKVNWNASSNATWCTVTPVNGNNSSNASAPATVTVNVQENNGTDARSATVTFRTSDNAYNRTVNVTQPRLLTPVISGFIPSEAQHGAALSIFGGNFNPTAAKNTVELNTVTATVVTATPTQVTVTVPKDTDCSGNIKVSVGSKTATSASKFSYVQADVVSTLAGSGEMGFADGEGEVAQFSYPRGITIWDGNLYVADTGNNCLRRVMLGNSWVSLFRWGSSQIVFKRPTGITVDKSNGFFYITDQGNSNCIYKVDRNGTPSVFATDKGQESIKFGQPAGITIRKEDIATGLYMTDQEKHCIYKVSPSEDPKQPDTVTISVFAGEGAYDTRFDSPADIAYSGDCFYVADYNNHCIRKVTWDGNVTTFAGSDKDAGFADGERTKARFNCPIGITRDTAGNLYVTDQKNHCIRKVTPSGVVSTIAGSGTAGFADGVRSHAQFNFPWGITIDASNNLYVADSGNHRIRKIVLE
jgi:sugar lactone lactonase YvrE